MVGNRIRQERLNQNITQDHLARSAGLNRDVVSRLENGQGCTLGTFIRILRVLGKLGQLDLFLPDPGLSPIALARMSGRKRKAASGTRGRKPVRNIRDRKDR